MMKSKPVPSEFSNLKGIKYFQFEEDFVEDNIRCIPMIVRLKMDEVGIKLKLSTWCKFTSKGRSGLAVLPIDTIADKVHYKQFLIELIAETSTDGATELAVDPLPDWKNVHQVPLMLLQKSDEFSLHISVRQWQTLTDLKRFALLKLCRPGHENKNFYRAIAEFGLLPR